jgi:hypothetical protein
MSYVGYRISKWETPASDIKQSVLERLSKNEEPIPDLPSENEPPVLIVVIRDVQENKQFRFLFHRCLALRIVKEEYATKLWSELSQNHPGTTTIVEDSPWIAELRENEPLFDVHSPNSQHYIIFTMDYLIEVLDDKPPKVEQIP